jgi:hypothetical protein
VRVARRLLGLADELERVMAGIESLIHSSMAGDLHAARALLEANRRIQAANAAANARLT